MAFCIVYLNERLTIMQQVKSSLSMLVAELRDHFSNRRAYLAGGFMSDIYPKMQHVLLLIKFLQIENFILVI